MDVWRILEIVGAAVGLVYLWLEYKANVWLWLAGIIMPALYIYVYYESGFYADMGINIYYLFAGIYGWVVWLGKNYRKAGNGPVSGCDGHPANDSKGGETLPVTRTPRKVWLPAMLTGIAFFAVIAWILINFTDSTVPYGDAFTTAFSIVALWMLARKYAEQWLVWLVVDVICCGLYLYKGLYYTGALYGLYSVISIFGYMKWLKMINGQDETGNA